MYKNGIRKFCRERVVVEDNDIDTQASSIGNLFHCTHTGIDSEDERHSFYVKGINEFFFHTVPIFLSMREDHRGLQSFPPKKTEKLSCSRNAVCIVVTDDADLLFFFECCACALHCSLHFSKCQRVT